MSLPYSGDTPMHVKFPSLVKAGNAYKLYAKKTVDEKGKVKESPSFMTFETLTYNQEPTR